MASAAFLGLSVHLYLRSGEHLSGTISAVDPVENALTIQSAQRGKQSDNDKLSLRWPLHCPFLKDGAAAQTW